MPNVNVAKDVEGGGRSLRHRRGRDNAYKFVPTSIKLPQLSRRCFPIATLCWVCVCLLPAAALLAVVSRTVFTSMQARRSDMYAEGRWPAPDDPVFNNVEDPSEAFATMLSYSSKPNETGCEDMTGLQREFCEISIGPKVVPKFEKYKALRQSCEWEDEDAFNARPGFLYQHFPKLERDSSNSHFDFETSQRMINDQRLRQGQTRLELRTCRQQAESHAEHWTIVRLGPMFSNGGYDWHRTLVPDIGNFAYGGSKFFTGFFFSPVDSKGEMLGNPPLHIHHMHSATHQCHWLEHLYNGKKFPNLPNMTVEDIEQKGLAPGSSGSQHWEFDIHGDRECLKHKGGPACLLKELPEGYAQLVTKGMCALGDINDQRPPNSPTLEFWLEWGYRWTIEKRNPVGFFSTGIGSHVVEVPFYSAIKNSVRERYNPEESFNFVDDYDVPGNSDSVIWGSFKFGVSLSFVQIYLHTHHIWTHDFLIFRGTPAQLGLNLGPLTLQNHYTPVKLESLGLSIRQLKTYLYNMMRRNGADLLCKMDENEFESDTPGVFGGILADQYERFAVPKCSADLSFRAGDIMTLVAFHGPRKGLFKSTSVQHSIMYGLYRMDDAMPQIGDYHPAQREWAISEKQLLAVAARYRLDMTRKHLQKFRDWLKRFSKNGA